jgi:hypothetical protein
LRKLRDPLYFPEADQKRQENGNSALRRLNLKPTENKPIKTTGDLLSKQITGAFVMQRNGGNHS